MANFTHTDLYGKAKLLRSYWFLSETVNAATVRDLAITSGARCAIIRAVGAGGWEANTSRPGGGAAFAATILTDLVPDEILRVQVGSTFFTYGAGSAQGDSLVTRVTGNSVVCKAVRGTGIIISDNAVTPIINNGGIPGLDTDCIGNMFKRSGKHGNSSGVNAGGGASGGDTEDLHGEGFGGRGARVGRTSAAGPGGGGIDRVVYNGGSVKKFQPGAGRVNISLYTKNPGYVS